MNYLSIIIQDDLGRPFHLGYEMSKHAEQRVSQRGIRLSELQKALTEGICHSKQGLSFYVLQDRVVVVIDENTAQVITAYRGSQLNLHIRKKYKSQRRAC